MVHFRFPIRQLPIALQDFATNVESIVDQVFNQSDRKGGKCDTTDANQTYLPAIDIYESELQFDMYIDLPGVKAEATKIEVLEDELVISGNRVAPTHR